MRRRRKIREFFASFATRNVREGWIYIVATRSLARPSLTGRVGKSLENRYINGSKREGIATS